MRQKPWLLDNDVKNAYILAHLLPVADNSIMFSGVKFR